MKEKNGFDSIRIEVSTNLTLAVKGVGGGLPAPAVPFTAVAQDSAVPPLAGARHRDEPLPAAGTPEARARARELRALTTARSTAARTPSGERAHRRESRSSTAVLVLPRPPWPIAAAT